ncbi:hypothetical protein BH10CYA1_BH10CYA1_04160 [soil metagenome]
MPSCNLKLMTKRLKITQKQFESILDSLLHMVIAPKRFCCRITTKPRLMMQPPLSN